MTFAIEVREFSKTFRGNLKVPPQLAAKKIELEVERGEIHGFLGPNGAGKSTTIKALLGLIRPDAGRLLLFGEPVDRGAWRGRVGYVPEQPSFYDYLTGLELVAWYGRLSGLARAEAATEARTHLNRVGLEAAMNRRLRTYSKGMVQRAGLAQALMGSPDLLILDEPMTGLDPIGRRDIRNLILDLAREGKTVFYSTHILPDIELTCDRVTIVDRGETRRTGRLDEILTETTRGLTFTLGGLEPSTRAELEQRFGSARMTADTATFETTDVAAAAETVEAILAAKTGRLVRFEPHRDDLESIFVRALAEQGESAP